MTQMTYRTMLNHLKTHAEEIHSSLNPQYIHSDFEVAFINAAKAVFPNSSVHGCYFHLTQSIWKNAVNRGLKVPFATIPEVRTTIQCLLALAFVPLPDVEEVFDTIVINAPQLDDIENVPEEVIEKLQDLLNYFDRTYLRGVSARGRRRAVSPRFPPPLWNTYQLVREKQQRSTNSVEGWHSRFSQMIVARHSGVWKFIENLKKDEHDNMVMMMQLSHGHTRVRHQVKAQVRRNQEMIERIVDNYQSYKDADDVLTYLKAIGYKLKLNNEPEPVNPDDPNSSEHEN